MAGDGRGSSGRKAWRRMVGSQAPRRGGGRRKANVAHDGGGAGAVTRETAAKNECGGGRRCRGRLEGGKGRSRRAWRLESPRGERAAKRARGGTQQSRKGHPWHRRGGGQAPQRRSRMSSAAPRGGGGGSEQSPKVAALAAGRRGEPTDSRRGNHYVTPSRPPAPTLTDAVAAGHLVGGVSGTTPVNTLIERTLGFSAIHWLAASMAAKSRLCEIVA